MNTQLATLTRHLTRDQYLLSLAAAQKTQQHQQQHPTLAPHLVAQRRLLALAQPPAAHSASSSSSASGSGSSCATASGSSPSPLSSLQTAALSVAELEQKLGAALVACRAALREAGSAASSSSASEDDDEDEDVSLDSDDDDDESMDEDDDDDEMDSQDEAASESDAPHEQREPADEDELPTPKPDDTYHRRMRRVCAWRAAVSGDEAECPSDELRPATALALKRKLSSALCAEPPKRARLAPAAVCAACERAFEGPRALARHADGAGEACRAAVAYTLEDA